MKKIPEEPVILAEEGESVQLRLESPETPIEDYPVFLLNGSSEAVGNVLGVEFEEHPTTSYSTSLRLKEPGDHVAHAIWAPDDELDLDGYETIDEIKNEDWLEVVEWEVNVLPESSTLDDIRQVIDDLIRAGTVAWAGKAILEKINDRTFDSDEASAQEGGDEDGEEEEYFQEVLSNFE